MRKVLLAEIAVVLVVAVVVAVPVPPQRLPQK